MAIQWTIVLTLTAVLTVTMVQARPPSLYWPGAGTQEGHHVQTRTHLDESALNGLNENELETLLYLLDKVERPRVVQTGPELERYAYAQPYYDTGRNKRTGASHLHAPPAKKAVDWSDYFGIDKREVKGEDMKANDLDGSTPSSPISSAPDAKDDKERDEIMKEFYSNMAMAGNARRKRNVRSHSLDKYMTKASESLVSDALKLTGAHRDEKMSEKEFKLLKKELVRRIGTAYNLEKLRQIFEGNLLTFGKNGVGQ